MERGWRGWRGGCSKHTEKSGEGETLRKQIQGEKRDDFQAKACTREKKNICKRMEALKNKILSSE